MAHIRKFLAATFAATFAVSTAVAQVTDDQVTTLVEDWLNTYASDFTQVVKDYGAQCIAPGIVAMPETAKQTIADAGGIENGLTALQTADPETLNAFLPALQECVDTMYVGEQIWAWVDDYYVLDDEAAKIERAVCLMNVVRPLPSDVKQTIFAAEDFATGIQDVMLNQPQAATNLDLELKGCI